MNRSDASALHPPNRNATRADRTSIAGRLARCDRPTPSGGRDSRSPPRPSWREAPAVCAVMNTRSARRAR